MRFRLPAGLSFFFFIVSRPALGPTQPPVLWIPAALSPGVERPCRETVHSPPSSAEFKNGGTIPPLPICLHVIVLN
jgi:hypothetical protein